MDIVDHYVQHLDRRALTRSTIERRVRCLAMLEAECGPLLEVDHRDIEAFLDHRDLGPVTRTNWLSHLHSFYAWAVVNEWTHRDPTARLTRPKLRRKLPRPIPETHYRLALRRSPTATMTAWLLLGGHAGLRCMEMAGLRTEEVDIDAGTIRVSGKGGKERVVPLHPRVSEALAPFLAGAAFGPVFVTGVLGEPFTAAQVSSLIGRHFRSCGIRATAHQLRHRFCSQILEETGDIAMVAELAGHESLECARIYAHVSDRRKHAAVRLLA